MRNLNEVYESGTTEIWYMTEDTWRNNGAMINAPKFKASELKETHILLGKIKETDPEKIFRMMQGEVYSPEGEARNLIQDKGLVHTSMSVGDVVVIDGKAQVVDGTGFTPLKP